MKELKNKKTDDLLNFWLGLHPESDHILDLERFYDFVISMFEDDDSLDYELLIFKIKSRKEWHEEYVVEFAEKTIDKILDYKLFLSFLSDKDKLR
jgi:hypothetical protein